MDWCTNSLGIPVGQALRFGFEYRLSPLDGPLILVLFVSSQMGIKRVFSPPREGRLKCKAEFLESMLHTGWWFIFTKQLCRAQPAHPPMPTAQASTLLGVPICAWWCCSSAQRSTITEPLKTGLIPWSSKGCGVSLRSLWVFAGREHLGKRSLRAWGRCMSAC